MLLLLLLLPLNFDDEDWGPESLKAHHCRIGISTFIVPIRILSPIGIHFDYSPKSFACKSLGSKNGKTFNFCKIPGPSIRKRDYQFALMQINRKTKLSRIVQRPNEVCSAPASSPKPLFGRLNDHTGKEPSNRSARSFLSIEPRGNIAQYSELERAHLPGSMARVHGQM